MAYVGKFIKSSQCKNVKKIIEKKGKGFPGGNQTFEKSKRILETLNELGGSEKLLENLSVGRKIKHLSGNLSGITQIYVKQKNPGIRMRFEWDKSTGFLYNVSIDDFHDSD